MKRTAINFFGRVLYSAKIKKMERIFVENYNNNWQDRSWEDYALECFKFQNQLKDEIRSSSGSERMDTVLKLQSLYNVREKELDFIEEKIKSLPTSELKYLFLSEYTEILTNVKNMDLNSAIELGAQCAKISISNDMKFNNPGEYVNACLCLSAVDELFGKKLDKVKSNIKGNKK